MVIVCCLSADEAKEDGRTGSDRRGGSGSGVARISHEELRGPVGGEGGDAVRRGSIALNGPRTLWAREHVIFEQKGFS